VFGLQADNEVIQLGKQDLDGFNNPPVLRIRLVAISHAPVDVFNLAQGEG
jgi:hypothetical protein